MKIINQWYQRVITNAETLQILKHLIKCFQQVIFAKWIWWIETVFYGYFLHPYLLCLGFCFVSPFYLFFLLSLSYFLTFWFKYRCIWKRACVCALSFSNPPVTSVSLLFVILLKKEHTYYHLRFFWLLQELRIERRLVVCRLCLQLFSGKLPASVGDATGVAQNMNG